MAGTMTADRIGAAARHDPQLRVPVRPALRRGIHLETGPDSVTVTGTPSRQVFRGRMASTLLPELLPLLDGSHDHAELADRSGAAEEVIFRVLTLLWTSGVVEEGASRSRSADSDSDSDSDSEPEIADEVADLLSRLGDSTAVNGSWRDAFRRWTTTRIALVGPPGAARRLRAELEHPEPLSVAAGPEDAARADLVVLLDEHTGAGAPAGRVGPAAQAAADAAWERGVPVVRTLVADGVVRVGPYVDPAFTPCLTCLVADEPDVGGAPGVADADLGTALVARELFSLVTRATASHLPARARTTDLRSWSSTDTTGATRPGCPRCSQADAAEPVASPLAVRYEALVAMPPKEFADPKGHQVHYKSSSMALQQQFRSWPSAPRVRLPEPPLERLDGEAGEPVVELSAEHLSLLLTIGAGLQGRTDERVFRWTAAGGNIGSVLAYVVVRRCAGLTPGIYAWLPTTGELARVGDDPATVPGRAPTTIVLTGDFLKVASKYKAFGLRILLLDSGCAQTSFQRVAHRLGLPMTRRSRWDDVGVLDAVDADPQHEPVTAVIDLGGTP